MKHPGLPSPPTRIPLNDLGRLPEPVRARIGEAVSRVLASGHYILGTECEGFEAEFAAFCGAAHCIGVGNGTDALEIALRALGIGSGDKVATVGNAGAYASTAIAQVDAEPVFVDVDPATHLMDLAALAERLRAGDLRAIVVTHLFGRMHDVAAVRKLAEAAGAAVIEDCAQAHGASRDGRVAGSVGHVGCFSFYPTKNLGAFGDAGALITNDLNLAQRIRSLRQYGWQQKYEVVRPFGRNSRMDEIQAAVLRIRLPLLDAANQRRRAIAALYAAGIRRSDVVCPARGGEDDVCHLYVVECRARDALSDWLRQQGIGTDVHYPIPDHRQPGRRADAEGSLIVTERLAKIILTLPCFPELTDRDVEAVVEAINAWTPLPPGPPMPGAAD